MNFLIPYTGGNKKNTRQNRIISICLLFNMIQDKSTTKCQVHGTGHCDFTALCCDIMTFHWAIAADWKIFHKWKLISFSFNAASIQLSNLYNFRHLN